MFVRYFSQRQTKRAHLLSESLGRLEADSKSTASEPSASLGSLSRFSEREAMRMGDGRRGESRRTQSRSYEGNETCWQGTIICIDSGGLRTRLSVSISGGV